MCLDTSAMVNPFQLKVLNLQILAAFYLVVQLLAQVHMVALLRNTTCEFLNMYKAKKSFTFIWHF